ncbi:IS1182-like element ISSdi1 family transposase OS=Streptomyces rimosus subsp. rimosus (strain ATCC 10970 / DSM 40260 / JCM 4667 / NRRL 2234) OX=1265868 GN=SRIM_026605 PE=4 SV=1 [Streptomyces rimosus subsp. rimosus]
MRLLEEVFATVAPHRLRALDEVEILRQVWVQHFHMVEGEVARRDPKDRPPGMMRLVTPYDREARGSVKRDIMWDGSRSISPRSARRTPRT